jgi:apolipoprotein N-acyltransferase
MRKIRLISAVLAGAIFSFAPMYHAMCVDSSIQGSGHQHSTMASEMTSVLESAIVIAFVPAAHTTIHCLEAFVSDSSTNRAESMGFVIYLVPAILGFLWFLFGILQRRYKNNLYAKIRLHFENSLWTFVDYKSVNLYFISISRT